MKGERGAALLIVLLTALLLSALALALVMASIGEALASGNARASRAAFYAADAGIERVLPDLQQAPDWDLVLSGVVTSGFTDGPTGGARAIPGGGTVVLDEVVNLANCGERNACDEASLTAITEERPWGVDNPRWRLFAWGPFPGHPGEEPSAYLVVLVGDDPLDGDHDPGRDGRGASRGRGVLLVRAQAYGSGGASRVIEATVARTGPRTTAEGYVGQRGGSGYTTGEAAAGVGTGQGGPARGEVTLGGEERR